MSDVDKRIVIGAACIKPAAVANHYAIKPTGKQIRYGLNASAAMVSFVIVPAFALWLGFRRRTIAVEDPLDLVQ